MCAEAAHTAGMERFSLTASSMGAPVSAQTGDEASTDCDTAGIQLSSRILLALQDPGARRSMSRELRGKGFRVIALDEPFAVWSMVADHASPRLDGFDFVICGGFRSRPDESCAPGSGARFFLLLGRGGFVPFAADGTAPAPWAFRRAGTPRGSLPLSMPSRPARWFSRTGHSEMAPGHTS